MFYKMATFLPLCKLPSTWYDEPTIPYFTFWECFVLHYLTRSLGSLLTIPELNWKICTWQMNKYLHRGLLRDPLIGKNKLNAGLWLVRTILVLGSDWMGLPGRCWVCSLLSPAITGFLWPLICRIYLNPTLCHKNVCKIIFVLPATFI